ncbi:MAG: type III-B CRISPR module RAMP protein Cmr6 [Chitinophagales bacterium]|nr:type III-B CRISPR module RAMP protein Cmr6 [Chitinophagales bacterium]
MKKGKIKVRANSVIVQISQADRYLCPDYDLPKEIYHNKECEFEADDNRKVTKLIVEGKEIKKNENKLKEQQEKEKRKKEREERQRRREEQDAKNKQLRVAFKNDSFSNEALLGPKDLLEADIESFEIENFNLKLNKYARWNKDEKSGNNPFSFFKTERGRLKYKIKENYGDLDIEGIAKRTLSHAKQLLGESNVKKVELQLDARLIAGLGTASVYETGITLHHIWGIPYIPASSIKGVLRSWIIQSVFGVENVPENEKEYPLHNAEFRAFQDVDFCNLFGCPAKFEKIQFDDKGQPKMNNNKYIKTSRNVGKKDQNGDGIAYQGKLIAFEAFPVSPPDPNYFNVDIMNPHYSKYYSGQGKQAPVDYDSPTPIPFLVVENTSFQFIIGNRQGNWIYRDKTLIDWLKEALEFNGIGAKTSLGYGSFQ